MKYLTREHYRTAKKNGISPQLAYARFYNHGWSIEQTITQVPQPKGEGIYKPFKEQCEQNGITRNLFYKRIKKGMTPEEAATRPKIPRGANGGRTRKLRRFL